MKKLQINRKVYGRFIRRYSDKLECYSVLGDQVSGMQWTDKNNKIVISCCYEKIAGIVSKSFFYNRIK